MLSADAIDREGLTVPKMPQSAIDAMREYIPVAGSSVNNPIDAFPPEEHIDDMLRTVASAEGIDQVFMSPMSGWPRSAPSDTEPSAEEIAEKAARAADQMARLQADTGTPVIGIQRSGRMARMMGQDPEAIAQAAYRAGIGVYPSVARAARTIAQILDWRAYREGLPDLTGPASGGGER